MLFLLARSKKSLQLTPVASKTFFKNHSVSVVHTLRSSTTLLAVFYRNQQYAWSQTPRNILFNNQKQFLHETWSGRYTLLINKTC